MIPSPDSPNFAIIKHIAYNLMRKGNRVKKFSTNRLSAESVEIH
jgi:hypothetical protein